MKIWMPYIKGGSGTDTWTETLARALVRRSCEVVLQSFHRRFESFPHLLSRVAPPKGTDIVLANSWNGFAFRRSGTRLVVVEHLCVFDPVLQPYKSRLQDIYHSQVIRRYETQSFRAADAVVGVSDYTAEAAAAAYGIPTPRTILNGVDTDFFLPRTRGDAEKDSGVVRLLFVGNLSARKGADLLVPIMQRLGAGYDLYYTAGLREDALAEAGLENLYPLGRLNQSEIREEYRRADLLLFPTRGEGMPLSVLESMACGTPVVASNLSSLPEVLNDEIGRLCPVDDTEAFVSAIRDVISDRRRLAAMRKSARDCAVRKFSLARMCGDYLALFEELLSAD